MAKLRIPSSLDIRQHRVPLLPVTDAVNVHHAVVFERRLSDRGAAKIDFLAAIPENGPLFRGTAWHGMAQWYHVVSLQGLLVIRRCQTSYRSVLPPLCGRDLPAFRLPAL
jgi:hypothetical protein